MFQLFYRSMIATLALGFTLALPAHADTEEIVSVEPQVIFVPMGFDNNDEVVAIVDGYLPDTCYRLRPTEVAIDEERKEILVQPRAALFPGPCLEMIVPYTTVIRLGALSAGTYRVATRSGKTAETLNVVRSSNPGPDDYLYAPVTSAQVHQTENPTARLFGRFTNTCSKIKEAKVINSGKTIEVLPIMEQTPKMANGNPCETKEIPFAYAVALPQGKPGRHLLHVRSLNGQSVNEAFTVPE